MTKKDMREIVKAGYNKGVYQRVFSITEKMDKQDTKLFRLLLAKLPKNPSILDLGCGSGIPHDKYLIKRGCNVLGIDISQRQIKLARKNVPEAKFVLGDFSKLRLNKKFDAVISMGALFHIPKEDQPAVFSQIRKALKSDGLMLVTLATGGGYSEEANWGGARMAWDSYDHDTYLKLVKKLGFRVLKTEYLPLEEGASDRHFFLFARKN